MWNLRAESNLAFQIKGCIEIEWAIPYIKTRTKRRSLRANVVVNDPGIVNRSQNEGRLGFGDDGLVDSIAVGLELPQGAQVTLEDWFGLNTVL